MSCEFKDESQTCFQTKKQCLRKTYKTCKYYLRQKPEDQELYNLRFRKALKKALEKRDIYEEYKHLLEKALVNPELSIFDNVQKVLFEIKTPVIKKKARRQITQEDLNGDILKNIASRIYEVTKVKILQKDEQKNTIIIEENEEKYVCEIKPDLNTFFQDLKKARKKDEYMEKQIINKVKIK